MTAIEKTVEVQDRLRASPHRQSWTLAVKRMCSVVLIYASSSSWKEKEPTEQGENLKKKKKVARFELWGCAIKFHLINWQLKQAVLFFWGLTEREKGREGAGAVITTGCCSASWQTTANKLGIYCRDNLPDSFSWCCMPDNSDRLMHH